VAFPVAIGLGHEFLLPKERNEASLLEMVIEGERFGNFFSLHDQHLSAIGQTPFLVETLPVEFHGPMKLAVALGHDGYLCVFRQARGPRGGGFSQSRAMIGVVIQDFGHHHFRGDDSLAPEPSGTFCCPVVELLVRLKQRNPIVGVREDLAHTLMPPASDDRKDNDRGSAPRRSALCPNPPSERTRPIQRSISKKASTLSWGALPGPA
jgi:hypothetical protein